jgi:predicted RNase H-like HicB family nuclease
MQKKADIENFEVVLEAEESGGYHVYAPSLKGCHSFGKTREEALKNIAEAIALWLESARELLVPIPTLTI